jgi:hypothetical protein
MHYQPSFAKIFLARLCRMSILLLSWCFTFSIANANTVTTPNLRSDNLLIETTVEFQTPSSPSGFTSAEPYSAVWHYKNSTYFVWIDAAYRAWVTQVTNGVATTVPIDTGTDYTVQPDGHHRFSLGVDSSGYIHVTGDMHQYINQTTGVINPYPVRYQKQTILYWKSNKPEDITGGFSFAGGLNASTAIPGGGWMLGRFFADNNGVLYYSSSVHAYESSTNKGQIAVGLYRYNVTKNTWTAIGGIAPVTQPNMYNVFPVFYWELSGLNGWFQNYEASFKFDSTNRLHFALTANTNSNAFGANRILYAVSADGGTTWKKANGATITGFPLRGIDGLPATADVVADNEVAPGFGASPGVATDKNGTVGVSVDTVWRTWNGSAWTTNNKQNITGFYSANYGYRLPNENLLFVANGVSKLLIAPSFHNSSIGYDYVNYGGLVDLDEFGLRTTGEIHAVGLIGQSSQTLLKTTITKAALPAGWLGNDISLTPPSYRGSASYKNGSFVVNNFGASIDNSNDSFYYVYKKMSGDGVMTARVVNTTLSTPLQGYPRLGIMMRNTLSSNSPEVSVLLAPGTNNKGVLFTYRSTTNGGTSNITSAAIKTTPYWLRLVRAGNVFTGFISPDGVTWTQTQTTTVPMNTDIYVGMASSSYANGYDMETATFDNVNAPAAIAK